MYDEKKKFLMNKSEEIKYETVQVDFLSERDIDILTKIGIPDGFMPYFYFCHEGISYYGENKTLCYLGGEYGRDDDLVITRNGEVTFFDSDNEKYTYVSKSLDAFLDSACEYTKFVNTINEKYGISAFARDNYTKEDVERLREAIKNIDEISIEKGFWAEQLDDLFLRVKVTEFIKNKETMINEELNEVVKRAYNYDRILAKSKEKWGEDVETISILQWDDLRWESDVDEYLFKQLKDVMSCYSWFRLQTVEWDLEAGIKALEEEKIRRQQILEQEQNYISSLESDISSLKILLGNCEQY